jgi:predicted ribosomally synthesized peptide with nif11-like leader
MPFETADAFYQRTASDDQLQQKVREISGLREPAQTKLERLVAVAHEAGFEVSPTDVLNFSKTQLARYHAASELPDASFEVDPHTCFFSDCDTNICQNELPAH